MTIQLSDHFTYRKLIRFTLPSITMMIFTSISFRFIEFSHAFYHDLIGHWLYVWYRWHSIGIYDIRHER